MDEEQPSNLFQAKLEESENDALLRAILEEAMSDLQQGSQSGANIAERAAMTDSLEWVEACGMDEGGFGWLVSGLRMQPRKTQRSVLAWFQAGCRREAA